MDPVAALADLFEADSNGAKRTIANSLNEWRFKGGFLPTKQAVYEECAKRGVAITPSCNIMLTLYGCPE
jgi:hypothetical protein